MPSITPLTHTELRRAGGYITWLVSTMRFESNSMLTPSLWSPISKVVLGRFLSVIRSPDARKVGI